MTGSGDVTVLIRYLAQAGKSAVAKRELDALVQVVLAQEPACKGIWIHENTAAPEQLLLVERWADEASYTGPHMQTPHIQAFMVRAREFIAGPPEITFWRGVGGMETGGGGA
ncbi:MAG: putative quinol monooxygenase [Gemmatimonadota bacterium]